MMKIRLAASRPIASKIGQPLERRTRPDVSAVKPAQETAHAPSTEQMFRNAVAEWTCEKGPTSSSRKLAAHPAFLRIVAMGQEAVPYPIREVKR